jgi:hypothetical protein
MTFSKKHMCMPLTARTRFWLFRSQRSNCNVTCHRFQTRDRHWRQLRFSAISKDWQIWASHCGLFPRFNSKFLFHSTTFDGVINISWWLNLNSRSEPGDFTIGVRRFLRGRNEFLLMTLSLDIYTDFYLIDMISILATVTINSGPALDIIMDVVQNSDCNSEWAEPIQRIEALWTIYTAISTRGLSRKNATPPLGI